MFLQFLMRNKERMTGGLQVARFFNHHILNPITLRIAGRPYSPYAIIRHIGRKTNLLHSTPVAAAHDDETFVVPLLYGEETDWCQNILAAKTCTIVWQGKAYLAGVPHIVDQAAGISAFPTWMQRFLRSSAQRTGNNQFLQLEYLAQTSDTEYRNIIREHQVSPMMRTVMLSIVGTLVAQTLLRRLRRRRAISHPLDQ